MSILAALNGKPFSGKTTLRNYLEVTHNFRVVDFSLLLKNYVSRALEGIGIRASVTEIERNKAFYRPLLQMSGNLIGFDTDPEYIYRALLQGADITPDGRLDCTEPVVFDAVRTVAQKACLQKFGFITFELVIPEGERINRMMDHGLSPKEVVDASLPDIEQGGLGDVKLDGTRPLEELYERIVGTFEEIHRATEL